MIRGLFGAGMRRGLTKRQRAALWAALFLAVYLLAFIVRAGAVTRQNRQGYVLALIGALEVTAYNLAQAQAGEEMLPGAAENAAKAHDCLVNGAETTRYLSWTLREQSFAPRRTGGLERALWRIVHQFSKGKSLTDGQAAYLQGAARAMERFCAAFPVRNGGIPHRCLTPAYYARQLAALEEELGKS